MSHQIPLPKIALVLMTTLSLAACGPNVGKIFGGDSAKKGLNGGVIYPKPLALIEAEKLSLLAPTVAAGGNLYASCDALKSDIERSLASRWVQEKAEIAMQIKGQLEYDERPTGYWDGRVDVEASVDSAAPNAGTSKASSPKPSDGQTNVQEVGVDEADKSRVGVDQIFVRSFSNLQVIDRKTLKLQGKIALENSGNAQIYTKDRRLILIETVQKALAETKRKLPASQSDGPSIEVEPSMRSVLRVRIFETKANAMPDLKRMLEIDGAFVDSRLINNQLGLEASEINWSDFSLEVWGQKASAKRIFDQIASYRKRASSVKTLDGKVSGIDCSSIIQRRVEDFDFSFAKTMTLNIDDDSASVKGVASIGQGDQIYVATDSIYLLKAKLSWLESSYYTSYRWAGTPDEKLFIRQISLDSKTGALSPAGEGQVNGHIKDSWALRSLNSGKNLIVASSTGLLTATSGPDIAQNHLFVMELNAATKSLDVKASVLNFGTREDICSIRYVDDKVYIVTFKKTDPLFAFDLSDLSEPKLLSGLKIPGFSTYMHPLADGRMLGIGFDALEQGDFAYYQGIQVSLFDVSNPMDMARIDNHIYGTRGSSSEVTTDHHAFFYDETSGLLALPIVELTGNELKGEETIRTFSGAILYKFTGDKIEETARLSHAEWIPAQCVANMDSTVWWQTHADSMDINRVYQIDNRLITLSPFGIKSYDLGNFAKATVTTMFERPAGRVCQPIEIYEND
jgi:inhibitor of cysteine peptidase